MQWFIPTLVMGILAFALYGASWLFRILHWPGSQILRIAALGAFIFGMILLVIYNVSKGRENREKDLDDWLDDDQ